MLWEGGEEREKTAVACQVLLLWLLFLLYLNLLDKKRDRGGWGYVHPFSLQSLISSLVYTDLTLATPKTHSHTDTLYNWAKREQQIIYLYV